MAQQQEQPPTEEQQELSPPAQDVDLKKASAREELAFLTSGAKERRDKTVAGMKGAAHIMTHPFNKQAKEEATAKTIEQKNEIGSKQERIRATAHIQWMEEKAIADGVQPTAPNGSGRPSMGDDAEGGEEAGIQGAQNEVEPSSMLAEHGSVNSASDDKISEDSSDSSSRGQARDLSQIRPDSKDYQSG